MSKFAYLEQVHVGEKTADYTFGEILVNGASPVLTVRPAGQVNKDYFNAVFKAAVKRQKSGQKPITKEELDLSIMDDQRDEDIEMFSKYVVTGWSNVLDGEGDELEFTAEDCLDFLQAIPEYMFDELRVFCNQRQNFGDTDDIILEPKAVEAKAKN